MYSQEKIDNLIKEMAGVRDVKPGDDLMNDLGVTGDDFHELIAAYAKRFKVDMTTYLWYFHAEEEGALTSIGRSFFKPPYQRVKHISVTPALLLESANKGRWEIQYPPHKLPRRRWDIIIDQVFFVVVMALVLYACLK